MATCVRSRYGPRALKLAAFLETWFAGSGTRIAPFPRARPFALPAGFALRTATGLGPQSDKGDPLSRSVTTSHARGGRNLDLLSIDYASRPRLRPRLTLGGRPLPRKPWPNGGRDSHPPSLLTPAYSLPCSPTVLPVRLRPTWNAPLPLGRKLSNPRIRNNA